MKKHFSKFFVLSLMFPYFVQSMEMPSQDDYQQFLTQYKEVSDEYAKIMGAQKNLRKAKTKGINISLDKYREFKEIQKNRVRLLKEKIKKLLNDYAIFSNTAEYKELGYLDQNTKNF